MSRRRPRTYRLPESQMRNLQGVAATFDGECARCEGHILVGQRVVKFRDGWAHCTCMSGGDE